MLKEENANIEATDSRMHEIQLRNPVTQRYAETRSLAERIPEAKPPREAWASPDSYRDWLSTRLETARL